MAINLFEKQCDKINSKYSSESPRGSALPSHQLVKLSIATDSSITSTDSKSIKTRKKSNKKSPYLLGDSVQIVSRIMEKKLYSQHKKSPDILSSFPLAANIYKASSDEFKSHKKGIKKVKKSVLTLPNAPTTVPQTCTVSDMNDSEYFNGSDDNRKLKAKKRFVAQNKKFRQSRNNDYEFYDRDASYCSQMNINLDCSSTDMITQFTGDGKSVTKKYYGGKSAQNEEFNSHDMWTVLRNINRFQFRPSPPISEDSIHMPKKKKIRNRRRNNRKDSVIETCRTEEFAYIKSIEVDSKSPRSLSQTSSYDRITVIDKQDEFSEICKAFEKRVLTTNNTKNRCPNTMHKIQSKKGMKNNLKAIEHKEQVHGLQNKNINECNKTRGTKECHMKGNNYENPHSTMKSNSKVVNPPNRNREKTDGVQVTVDRADEFDHSLCSESSKVAITATRKDDNTDNLPKVSSDESDPHMKGITKVILSNGPSLKQPKKYEMIKRKPCLVTTMPSTTVMPKLTQTEIRRRLANLKFPIVVLGKDQLTTASIQVMNNDLPHLISLDQPVWPFMKTWFNDKNEKKEHAEDKTNEISKECNLSRNKHQGIERKNNLRKSYEINGRDQYGITDKNCKYIESTQNQKKYPKRPLPPNEITKIKPQQSKKSKPMRQLKDKMLKLLYKNTSSNDIDDQLTIKVQRDSECNVYKAGQVQKSDVIKKVDVSTETFTKYEFIPNHLSTVSSRPDVKKVLTTRQPWAKARWASDFIETVINKIRSGIYFNQENKDQQRALKTELKEASIQTLLCGNNFSIIEQLVKEDSQKSREVVPYEANDCLEMLPGFDDSLPALEILTLNMKEVAVKYCSTNVMVQFDVAVPSGPESLYPIKKCSSLVPLVNTESHTKIFKCKTRIVNAMLPAEICSLLPKIIQSIIDFNNVHSNNKPALPPTTCQNESPLYTTTQLGHSESTDILKLVSLPPPVTRNIPANISKLLDGVFSGRKTSRNSRHNMPKVSYVYSSIIVTKDLLMDVSVQKVVEFKISPISFIMPKAGVKQITCQKYDCTSIAKINTCTTLDLYRERNPSLDIILCKKTNVLESLWKSNVNIRFKILTISIPLDVTLDGNKVLNLDGKTIDVQNFKIDSLFNGFLKHNNNTVQLKAIEYKNHTENKTNKKEIQNHTLMGCAAKTRRRRFVKLYKKCKSTSNISGERYSTSLSKITTLDDFFQALGAGKILTSIFDGLSGRKILSSIIEMKNWITDLSQRQAMLVLLLTNKKDTPNLVRFRPILLQGIAVNRITRASELDMEIEVIEREHFNKFAQYKGIPCLTGSIDNQDNLMEELYWIAKTTASDYQRPFNEASEKLLKSLLEKRKKLNPSYLRVMARYVGLGLLKSPKN